MPGQQPVNSSTGAWANNRWFITHQPNFWTAYEMRRQEPNPDVNEPPPDVNTPPPDVIAAPADAPLNLPPDPPRVPEPDHPDPPPEGDPPPDEPARILMAW